MRVGVDELECVFGLRRLHLRGTLNLEWHSWSAMAPRRDSCWVGTVGPLAREGSHEPISDGRALAAMIPKDTHRKRPLRFLAHLMEGTPATSRDNTGQNIYLGHPALEQR